MGAEWRQTVRHQRQARARWRSSSQFRIRSLGKKGISAFVVPTDNPRFHRQQVRSTKWAFAAPIPVAIVAGQLPVAGRLPSRPARQGACRSRLSNLEGGRIGIAAQAIGIARAAFEAALAYARTRKQFDQPDRRIRQHRQHAGGHAHRRSTRRACSRIMPPACAPTRLPCLSEACQAKLYASEMAEQRVLPGRPDPRRLRLPGRLQCGTATTAMRASRKFTKAPARFNVSLIARTLTYTRGTFMINQTRHRWPLRAAHRQNAAGRQVHRIEDHRVARRRQSRPRRRSWPRCRLRPTMKSTPPSPPPRPPTRAGRTRPSPRGPASCSSCRRWCAST